MTRGANLPVGVGRRALLAAMLAPAALSAAPAATTAMQFGVCVHLALGRSNAATVNQLITEAGMTGLRDDVYWSSVERSRGHLEYPRRFDELDAAVTQQHAAGQRPMLILGLANRLYDGGGLIQSEEGLEAFERYVRFTVRHFGNRVDQYEVWNEWNTGFGSNPRQRSGDARAYVRLLARSARAIREENPAAQVIGGVTAGVDMSWTRAFLEAGGLSHVDAYSVHSYTTFRKRNNPEGAIRLLDELKVLLGSVPGGGDVPIFVTEMGWPMHSGRHGVSEEAAASYLVRFMLLAISRPWIHGVFWYDLFDDGDDPSKSEHRFGMVRRDLSRRPVFSAARQVAQLMKGRTTPRSYRLGPRAYAVRGENESGVWMVAWRVEYEESVWDRGFSLDTRMNAGAAEVMPFLPDDGVPILLRQRGARWHVTHSIPRR